MYDRRYVEGDARRDPEETPAGEHPRPDVDGRLLHQRRGSRRPDQRRARRERSGRRQPRARRLHQARIPCRPGRQGLAHHSHLLMREFFDAYARAADSVDLTFFESAYAETFMFAGPAGVQAVKRDDFLKVLPRRKAFFASIGLTGTQVSRLDETMLDELHTMVRVQWALRFEKAPRPPIVDQS